LRSKRCRGVNILAALFYEKEEKMITEVIQKVVTGVDLSETEMQTAMSAVIDGKVPNSQVAAFVTALRMKGETVAEITGAARAIGSQVVNLQLNNHLVNLDRDDINLESETILKVGDTGDNHTRTFNVSTATALVLAGGGLRIARHGIRSENHYFGSADVLADLGIELDISQSDVKGCINKVGIGFLFIPFLHGPMRHVAPIRREIGIRTIFNLVSPLLNPAGATAHVLGVYEPALTEKLAQALKNLGASRAFVFFGEKTFDEISICGVTRISRLVDGQITTATIQPEDYGMERVGQDAIRGGNSKDNARIINAILNGDKGAYRDIVLLNAAAGFVVAGLDSTIENGIDRSADVIDSGKARQKLEALVQYTQQCKPFVRKDLDQM
jgi:anthranilate phosphoribosyltransferase